MPILIKGCMQHLFHVAAKRFCNDCINMYAECSKLRSILIELQSCRFNSIALIMSWGTLNITSCGHGWFLVSLVLFQSFIQRDLVRLMKPSVAQREYSVSLCAVGGLYSASSEKRSSKHQLIFLQLVKKQILFFVDFYQSNAPIFHSLDLLSASSIFLLGVPVSFKHCITQCCPCPITMLRVRDYGTKSKTLNTCSGLCWRFLNIKSLIANSSVQPVALL